MKVRLYTKVQGGADEIREHEWKCIGCGDPNPVSASNYCRCWDCHSDAIGVQRGYITMDEYIRRTGERARQKAAVALFVAA